MDEEIQLPLTEPGDRPLSVRQRVASILNRLLDRYQPGEGVVLIATALVVGIFAGLGAILFRWILAQAGIVFFVWFPAALAHLPATFTWLSSSGYILLAPILGALPAGWMIARYAGEAKGHGVPEVMEAVALRGGRIRPVVPVIKYFASALTIGSGGSAGAEGPIVQIGAGIGSGLGQLLRLSDDRIQSLVACGAAGGIAAVFNAPIAGVIFAVEIILGEFSVGNLTAVVLASVTSSIIGRIAFGESPAFAASSYSVQSLWEFPIYAVLGILAGLVSVLFVRVLYWTEDRFDESRRLPGWVQPAVGAAMLGLMALIYGRIPGLAYDRIPQVFGVGYDTITMALHGGGTVSLLLALMLLKILATSFTLGSGGSGGVFAPALFVGSTLGAACGLVVNQLWPNITAPVGAYALVGMAAAFAGSTHASVTAIVMIFELTGDYRLVLPLMLSVVISTLLARRMLHGESIYTLKLSRRGIRIAKGRDVDVMQGVLVREAMTTRVDTVPTTMTLDRVRSEFARTQHHGFPVVDEAGKLYGIVTVQDSARALEAGMSPETPVAKFAERNLVVAYPDEPMADALHRLSVRGIGRLPVVSRKDHNMLLGAVRRSDILRAYNIALTRRADVQHRTARMRLRNVDHTEFIELEVASDSRCVGSRIQDLADSLPHDAVLVSVRRANGEVIIPHGDTILESGDQVVAFADEDAARQLADRLLGNDDTA
ncbi:MAG: chloride channel protein [Anaerolineales bacterium]|nr:chloride channel protein [Anaerolineales bacterium]